jgi:hypothetical protein
MIAPMFEFVRLAGYYAAHGVWSVSDGGTLLPILGYQRADTGGMHRYVGEDGPQVARNAFEANEIGAQRAVLVVDGYVHLPTGRTDALLIDAIEYGPAARSITMALPYRPKSDAGGFAVHRPKFLKLTGVERTAEVGEAFFAGVDSHEQAAPVWNAHLDESL